MAAAVQWLLVLVVVACHLCGTLHAERQELRMPAFRPNKEDMYMCTAFKVDSESYITQYEALADAGTAHHILLYGCKNADHPVSQSWQCSSACRDGQIMFAWAKNADATRLPEDVGFHIGGHSDIDYLVMQIHYARTISDNEPADRSGLAIYKTHNVPKYTQGIYLLVSGSGVVPPHKAQATVDVSCKFEGDKPIHVFAYRTHAHTLSRIISSYKKPAGHPEAAWQQIGKGNPQWPQAFYPLNTTHVINPGDIVAGRCVYDSTGSNTVVKMGPKHTDEMCNFYMMYYVEGEAEFEECVNNQLYRLTKSLPADSLVPLPPNPKLDSIAHGHHHHGMGGSDNDDDSVQASQDQTSVHYVTEDADWFNPPPSIPIGQIAGVDVDAEGNTVIFHRGPRTWGEHDFDFNGRYLLKDDGPITQKTLLRLNESGSVSDPTTDAWGDNLFYLPHGLTIDTEGNIWVTDVALHQVMKFPAGEKTTPSLVLGEQLVPGSDESHFCKPTDVAVRTDGSAFYVADGYCNGRILMYNPNGEVIRTWGSELSRPGIKPAPNVFFVPHSLSISDHLAMLCVADRENSRLQCFDLEGQYKFMVDMEKKAFGIVFKPKSDQLIAAEADQSQKSGSGEVLKMSATNGRVVGSFKPKSKSFGDLHDIAISADGGSVYICQIHPPNLWKFKINSNDAVNMSEVIGNLDGSSAMQSGGTANMPPEPAAESQKVPIVVALLLAIPVLCVVIVLLTYKACSDTRKKKNIHGRFDMGRMFSNTREDKEGFSPLTAQEDHYTDDEYEDESDVETRR